MQRFVRLLKIQKTPFQFGAHRKYTNEHEWITYSDDKKVVKVGITDYAQKELGDIVHIEMPKIGLRFQKSGVVGAIESVKVAADIYAPVSGVIVHINEDVLSNPSIVNEDAEKNWIFEADVSISEELDHLMTKQQYDDFLANVNK